MRITPEANQFLIRNYKDARSKGGCRRTRYHDQRLSSEVVLAEAQEGG